MQRSFKNIILKISLFFLFLTVVSMLIQKTFYPVYVDDQGFLHETLWIPIGAFSFALSMVSFAIYFILLTLKSIKRWIK